MAEIAVWGVIAALAALTFTTRLSFIALFAHTDPPDWLRRPLLYIPPAMLAAIVAVQVFAETPGAGTVDGSRVIAALLALMAAYRTRNMILIISVGMATLWGVRALLGQ